MNKSQEKDGKNNAKIANGYVIGIVFLLLLTIAAFLAFLGPASIGKLCILAFWIGGLLILFGYYHLVYVLPRMSKDVETRISMEALRASFWLVIFGLVLVVLAFVLGFLLLMGKLPL
jgi:heme/copper-type cytochrome/quinol oxidase subunit 4